MTHTVPIRSIYVRALGLSSRLIEIQGGGGFSHCATRLANGLILDARSDDPCGNGKGVQIRAGDYLDDEPYVELERWVPKAQAELLEGLLQSQIGKPYDKLGILGFATSAFWDRNWRDLSAWFCDDLRLWGFERARLCAPVLLPPFKFVPGVVMQIELQNGAVPVRWNRLRAEDFAAV